MDSTIDLKFFEILEKNLPLDILEEYEDTCFSFAMTVDNEPNGIKHFFEKRQRENLQEESNTWALTKILKKYASNKKKSLLDGYAKDPLIGLNCSKKSLANRLEESTAEINKTLYVKQWLQDIYWKNKGHLIEKNFNFDLSSQSMWSLETNETVKKTYTDENLNQEKLVDPNGILQLCQNGWSFVRSGREAEAIQYFEHNGHAWRAAMMFGSHLPSDRQFDNDETSDGDIPFKSGNPYSNLFRKTLLSMLSNPSNLNVYEKAIMGTQAGHLKSILGACATWEDHLWAHYFVKHDAQTNLELENFITLNGSFLEEDDSSLTHQPIFSEEDIFTTLKTSEDSTIKELASSPFHYIQSCIILSSYNELIRTLATWAKNIVPDLGIITPEGVFIQDIVKMKTHNTDVQQPSIHDIPRAPSSILRFGVHFIIYLDKHGIWQFTKKGSEQVNILNAATIFQAYTTYLSTLNQFKLIPYYLSFFPNLYVCYRNKKILFSTSTYATLLMRNPRVIGHEEEYLKIAEQYGLDVLGITTHMVEHFFDSSENDVSKYNDYNETSESKIKNGEENNNNNNNNNNKNNDGNFNVDENNNYDSNNNNSNKIKNKLLEEELSFDLLLIQQLKWLTFDKNQSYEIIKQSNRLIRRFIVNKRPQSVSATYTYLREKFPNYLINIEKWITKPGLTLNNVENLFDTNDQINPAFIDEKQLVTSIDLNQLYLDTLRLRLIEGNYTTQEEISDLENQVIQEIKQDCRNRMISLPRDLKNNEKGVDIKNAIREHLSFFSYLEILKNNEIWKGISIKLRVEDQFSWTSIDDKLSKLTQNDMQLLQKLETDMYQILKSPSGWLSDIPSSYPEQTQIKDRDDIERLERNRQIKAIKSFVIPQIFFILHQLFSETGKISSCVDLAYLATDARYNLLPCFPVEEVKKLMLLISKSEVKEMELKLRS